MFLAEICLICIFWFSGSTWRSGVNSCLQNVLNACWTKHMWLVAVHIHDAIFRVVRRIYLICLYVIFVLRMGFNYDLIPIGKFLMLSVSFVLVGIYRSNLFNVSITKKLFIFHWWKNRATLRFFQSELLMNNEGHQNHWTDSIWNAIITAEKSSGWFWHEANGERTANNSVFYFNFSFEN